MISKLFSEAIRIIYNRLKGQEITWAFTGSTSFALQGMDVKPNDIDIQTNKVGVYKIENVFGVVSQHLTFVDQSGGTFISSWHAL